MESCHGKGMPSFHCGSRDFQGTVRRRFNKQTIHIVILLFFLVIQFTPVVFMLKIGGYGGISA